MPPTDPQPALPVPSTRVVRLGDLKPISASMDKALADVMAKLPPSSGRGFVAVTGATTGLRAEVGHRFASSWAVAGWAGLAKGHGVEAGFTLEGRW